MVALRTQSTQKAETTGVSVMKASRRHFNSKLDRWVIKVLPGEYYVTGAKDEVLLTVLGSCVTACMRDPETGFGGINHFMLPSKTTANWEGDDLQLRYGNYAMEVLLNEILKTGCPRSRIEMKLFGGGNVINSNTLIGTKNTIFVKRFAEREGVNIAREDLGGSHGRRIMYEPSTGKAWRRFISTARVANLVTAETRYLEKVSTDSTVGSVELFE